ncbi:MAG: GTP-binding protein [Thermoplasmata archaeon]|nr:MAG: GTP-binding protein [Thermoplasmata archaeon]
MHIKKKIVLLGDSGVGKSSLIRRCVFDRFEDSYTATVGTKVTKKILKIPTSNRTEFITLMIWDLLGSKGYQALHTRTFVGAHGALLVSDRTRKETLDNLEQYWIPSLFEIVDHIPLVFVCNKSDMKAEFEFEYDDLTEFSHRFNGNSPNNLPIELEYCYSTSAQNGSNVKRAFESLGHLVMGSEEIVDPVKDLYECLMATRIRGTTDKATSMGAMDAIIVDFCDGFDDTRMAMLILRTEIARASIDINNPTKECIINFVQNLAEAENEFLNEKTIHSNLERRMNLALHIGYQGPHHPTENDFASLRPFV